MKFVRILLAIFRSYDFRDRLISVFALVLILGMFVKMMVFPYGVFGFGESDIYTEGIVSQNGIQSINPLFVDYNDADREISRLVFSGLMKYDPVKQAITDDMATLTINEAKTEYTFTLRDGLKWHDGKPLTASDVYFTFHDLMMAETFPNEVLKANFQGVLIEKIDDKTVKFILEQPNVFFVTNMTTGIVPEHILKGVDPFDLLQHNFNKLPIGSGPYMMSEPVEVFPDGRMQVTLTRNPNYYGEPSEIETMRIVVYPFFEQLLAGVNALNGVIKVTGDYLADFAVNERFTLFSYELPQYSAVFMNMESAILKDQLVRLALQKAIDKDLLLANFKDKIRVDTPLIQLDQSEWAVAQDLDQAKGALKESGYSYLPDDTEKTGFRYNSDGEALELKFVARAFAEGTYKFEETQKVMKYLQEVWESIGINVKVEFLEPGLFEEAVASRQYDLLLVGQNMGYNLDTYSYWHSSQANPLGLNLSNYKSFQVDTLIEAVRSTFDSTERENKLTQLAGKIKEDIPAIFLFRPIYFYASDGKISGIVTSGLAFPSDRYAKISEWRFER